MTRFLVGKLPLTILLAIAATAPLARAAEPVRVIEVTGMINPVTAEFILDQIEQAEKERSQCLIIELDTPGGLDTSMRKIIQRELSATVPIVVYVSPKGARAASAGAFLAMAADVSAMAPDTTIGAAHPVEITGGKASDKIANDAAAYLRTIAEKKGRNMEWANDAVLKSAALTETEAVKSKVADLVAENLDDLLTKLNDRKIDKGVISALLKTQGAPIRRGELGAIKRFFQAISDPNIVYLLLILGFYALVFEVTHPGFGAPGIIGIICILLALYSFGNLPVNLAGLALMVFGVILFIVDLNAPTHGALTAGGIVALALGSFLLFRSGERFIQISKMLIFTMVAASAGYFAGVLPLAIRAQRRKVSQGAETLLGQIGEAKTNLSPKGIVHVAGEEWNAIAQEGTISQGSPVKVITVEGLTLKVVKA